MLIYNFLKDNTDTCIITFPLTFSIKKSRLNKNQSPETIIVKINKLMFLLIDSFSTLLHGSIDSILIRRNLSLMEKLRINSTHQKRLWNGFTTLSSQRQSQEFDLNWFLNLPYTMLLYHDIASFLPLLSRVLYTSVCVCMCGYTRAWLEEYKR